MPNLRPPRRAATGSGRRLMVAVVVATLVLGVAGCGAYTKRDFDLRAEGICNATLRQLRLLPQPQADSGASVAARLSALGAYLKHALPLLRSEAHALDAVRRPSLTAAQERALNRYLAALHTADTQLTALAAATRDDNPTLAMADERRLAADPLTTLAAAAGLPFCSNATASYT